MERGGMPQLTDEQVQDVLRLSREADTFELKLTVPEEDRFQTLTALDVDPLQAHIRQVFFFDTPELALDSAGLVVRARRTQERPDDSVVKLRPVEPEDLPDETRAAQGFGVEIDAMPGGYVCSASFKAKLAKPRVKGVARGETPVHKAFTEEQRAFYAAHAASGVALDELVVLGPVAVFKLKLPVEELGRKLTLEMWNYPDGSRILELSTKCEPSEAFQVAAEARAYLSSRGVDLSGEQTTKTRTALEYFTSQL
jgi:hypothetical protein